MRTRQRRDMKRIQHTRHIEGTAVKRRQQGNIIQQDQELVQILMLDESMKFTAMPTCDYGGCRVVIQTVCFDVEVRCLIEEMMENSPFVLRHKTVQHVSDVVRLQCIDTALTLFGQFGSTAFGNSRGIFQHVRPGPYAGGVQLGKSRRADAFAML